MKTDPDEAHNVSLKSNPCIFLLILFVDLNGLKEYKILYMLRIGWMSPLQLGETPTNPRSY